MTRVAGHLRKPKVSRRGAPFHVKHIGSSLGAKCVRHWAESHLSACRVGVLSLRPSHRDLDRNAVASCALHRYRLAAPARRVPPRKILLLLVHWAGVFPRGSRLRCSNQLGRTTYPQSSLFHVKQPCRCLPTSQRQAAQHCIALPVPGTSMEPGT